MMGDLSNQRINVIKVRLIQGEWEGRYCLIGEMIEGIV